MISLLAKHFSLHILFTVCVCKQAAVLWPCLPLSHTRAHTHARHCAETLYLSLSGLVPNGTLHVHLRSYGLTTAAACACPLSPRLLRCPIPDFSVQKGARVHPLCGRYAPSIRTSAKLALRQALQQISTRQSKQHYITKVRTQRKTTRV